MTPPPLPEAAPASELGELPRVELPPPPDESSRSAVHRLSFPVRSPTEPDPLQDAPEVIWYIRPPTGGQYGPAGREVVRSWLAEGRITPDSQVWREGWRDWKEAAEVFPDSAFPQLRIPDALPGLERILNDADSAMAGTGRRHGGRASVYGRLFLVMVLVALGGGILAAVYVWARFY